MSKTFAHALKVFSSSPKPDARTAQNSGRGFFWAHRSQDR